MTDEREERVAAAYRTLGAEEPPRALDEAILAAARKPARSWTQRHAVPLGLAAVLVLSVTVTLRIQQEAPEIASPVASTSAPPPAPVQEAPLKLKVEEQVKAMAPPAKPAQQNAVKSRAMADAKPGAEQAPAAAAAPSVSAEAFASRADRSEAGRGMETSVAGAVARQHEERTSRDAAAAARAPQVGPVQALAKRSMDAQEPARESDSAPRVAAAAPPRPEAELERIAGLRRDGRHDEADKALAEFRKRYPDYRIAEDLLRRVERR